MEKNMFLHEICKEYNGFFAYIKRNRWQLLLSLSLFLLVWGGWIYNIYPRMDTSYTINDPHTFFNWLTIGRYGLIVTEYVFGLRWFNPFFNKWVGYVLLWFSGIIFGYIFGRLGRKAGAVGVFFPLLFAISPIMAEQLYFELQVFQIAWAYCVCAFGVGFCYVTVLRKSTLSAILAVLCMIWAFSSYQAFVPVHIAAVICGFLLFYHRMEENEEKDFIFYFKICISLIGLFVLAMVLNAVITNLFFTSSGYIEGQIAWGKSSVAQCLENIWLHIKAAFLGEGIFFTVFYGVCACGIVAFIVLESLQKKRWGTCILYVLSGILLQVVPFLITIYAGSAPVVRSQLSYPFVLACDMVFLFSTFKRNRQMFPVLVSAAVICSQTKVTMRLIYTDQIRATEDIQVTTELEDRIGALGTEDKPVAFIGTRPAELNNACLRGEIIGVSMYDMGAAAQPRYWWSSDYICSLSTAIGRPITTASDEQILEARKIALNMPSWPDSGSVADAGEYIIVKLSNDVWSLDLMELGVLNTITLYPNTDGMYTYNAKLTEDGSLYTDGMDSCVLYGPYFNANSGVYDFTLNYEVLESVNSATTVGMFDICTHGGSNVLQSEEISADKTSMTISGVSFPDVSTTFESRVHNRNGAKLRIISIEITKMDN